MHEAMITTPGGTTVVIRVYDKHESQPPPIDTDGEEVPESRPGLARCGDCKVVELRRAG